VVELAWFRRRYGAGPLHLLALLACLAFAGYIATIVVRVPEGERILIWFAGAAVAHDLILWPLYAVADMAASRTARRHPDRLPAVPWVNHLRVPVVLSAVMLAISFPLVFRWSEPSYRAASGLTENVYLGRWLLLSGSAFGLSALIYAFRVGRVLRRKKDKPVAS
jgi:ABC-type transport system involved in cytochrome c biogenesis permease subunit